MAGEALLDDSTMDREREDTQGFHAQWQDTDTTLLAPTNLPMARVRRAWERKPLSPLSRSKKWGGKIWKRARGPVPPSLANLAPGGVVLAGGKRGRTSLSPVKVVKKLRLDSQGRSSPDARWEERASPGRRIVTRSSAGGEEIVALAEEDEEEDVDEEGEVTVEVFDQEGRVVDVAHGEVEDELSWSDVEDEEEEEDGVFEPTLTHLPDAASHPVSETVWNPREIEEGVNGAAEDAQESRAEPTISTDAAVVQSLPVFSAPGQVILPEGFVSPAKQRRKLGPRSSRTVSAARRQTLPVQFAPAVTTVPALEPASVAEEVEEVEEEVPVQIKEAREELENEDAEMDGPTDSETQGHVIPSDAKTMQETDPDDLMQTEDNEDAAATTDEWEDVNEEDEDEPLSSDQDTHTEAGISTHQDDKLLSSPAPSIDGPHPRLPLRRSPRRKSSNPLKQSTVLNQRYQERPHLVAFTPLKRPQTANRIEHDVSISPGHEAETRPSANTTNPTPRASSAPSPPTIPSQTSPRKPNKPRVSDDTALLQAFLNRAAESKSSSHRRLSASEKESLVNRRDSDTVRQALASPPPPSSAGEKGMGNETVLVDLDPNTSSPRKAAVNLGKAEGEGLDWDGGKGDKMNTELIRGREAALTEAHDDDDVTPATAVADPAVEQQQSTIRRTRSGGRERKKPQVYSQQTPSQLPPPASAPSASGSTTPSGVLPGPSRITIRGSAQTNDPSFRVKKTEAQELAIVTRSNTRKNKGGSLGVRGTLARTALVGEEDEKELGVAAEGVEVDGGEAAEGSGSTGERGRDAVMARLGKDGKKKKQLTWSETLVSFYQGDGAADDSLSGNDEVEEEKMPWERGADFDPTIEAEVAEPPSQKKKLAKPVPAAETPSKPKSTKMRKLRTPKTAASTAATAAAASGKKIPALEAEMGDAATSAGEVEVQAAETETKNEEKTKPKPVPKARRSRIATPAAKSVTGSALLPPDLLLAPTTNSVTAGSTGAGAGPGKAGSGKRATASRLAPPGSIAAAAVTGQSKETGSGSGLGLGSSPAKKPRANFSGSTSASAAAGRVGSLSFAPPPPPPPQKLDFKAAENFKPVGSGAETNTGAVPGLTSPAKKPPGRPRGVGGVAVGVGTERDAGMTGSGAMGLGLGLGASPAKRSRRRAG